MTWKEAIPELTNGEFEKFTKGNLAFIDFFAEWCMPCTMMSPRIEDLSEEFGSQIKFGKVNVDDNQKIAQKFEITSIPTFVLIKDSEILERISGTVTQDELEEVLKKHL